MERAAGHAGRQAARLGLLTAGVLACASVQTPPGGPPDPAPPVLLSVVPDSGVSVSDFTDPVTFEFDEVIREQGLDELFTVSPRHERIDVSWHRRRVRVRPGDGWRDSVVYRVSMLPGITDLRSNRLDSSRTVTFSTGGPIPTTIMTGNTVDWERSRIAPRSLIEAIRPADSLTYFTFSDSTGRFSLDAVPPGRYLLVATLDQNTNQRRDRRESFDSATVDLDSSLAIDFWMFAHDTVGPRIQTLNYLDSLAVEVVFNQSLALELPHPGTSRVLLLPDSLPVPVAAWQYRAVFDSVRAAEADSLAAIADSLAALADTLPPDPALADTVAPRPVAIDTTPPAPDPGLTPDPNAPDPAQVARMEALLAERDQPTNTLVLVLGAPLARGERYVVETTVNNLLGIAETSLRVVVTPAPPDSS